MKDVLFKWSDEVHASAEEAASLGVEIDGLTRDLDDLVAHIRDLGTVGFADDVEDYEILTKAQQLWSAVSSGVAEIRSHIDDARSSIRDVRRVVDFYG
ncbi:hypothetical protein RCF27_09465 [Rhodococcus pyridinivorans]|uniref:hypothetical protein n=1 Tax=Rhodococcus pyridinivorans TaxID=103816 RepID=UPI00280B76A1|nr:hypothetical protein [Rhodococcus pyridinivorans]WMM74486.1 hypothetical protein RCF27_09465 [Rhodococcus pyridinivorans]